MPHLQPIAHEVVRHLTTALQWVGITHSGRSRGELYLQASCVPDSGIRKCLNGLWKSGKLKYGGHGGKLVDNGGK